MTGFVKATKTQARARVAFAGPAGSGKTFTALLWARELAGPDGRIAVIDTERASASLYSDLTDFDVLDMSPPYDPRRLVVALSDAAAYDVTIVDSVSHFWAGEGGVLEIIDQAKIGGDTFRAWSKGTPIQQRMVDGLLRHPGHVIVTMRSKTEYALSQENGKSRVQKLGMAPVQRDGIEYEFTIMLDIDLRHVAHVGKTRCPALADRDIPPEQATDAAREFHDWLTSGAAAPEPADPAALKALSARLEALPGGVAGQVKVRWGVAGLPVLRHLTTAAHLQAANDLVTSVSDDLKEDEVPA